MKTRILRTVCIAFSMVLVINFVAKAQQPFYDTKWENGKMVSRTEYVMGDYGLYVQKTVSKLFYDESGDFLKKEVSVWNGKYSWIKNDYRPDYNENNYIPLYCITRNNDLANGFVFMELLLWDKEKKAYDKSIEKMIFQLNDANMLNYLAYQKGEKYVEWVNNYNIRFDRELLAKLVK